jgi:hypothetical protein
MKAVSAHVTHPNTIETDRQDRVIHTVILSNGLTSYVWATDPIDAINVVNGMIENHQTFTVETVSFG